jgi:LacI family transcriptional regulator
MSSIRDVAQRAGVSISTVSRVLNNSCPVSADKRERVEEAARELGYIPNPAARSLLLRKTGVLGVVVPFATGEFFSEFLSGVDQTASDHKYFLLISISHRSDEDLRMAVANLNKRVDGLLVWAPEVRASDVKSLVSRDLPTVFLNSLAPSKGDDLIDFDNYGGMYSLASHLIRQGHRDIAFLKGPPRAADAKLRLEGFRAALSSHGMRLRPDLEFDGEYTVEAGYKVVPRVLRITPPPTAIMAPNDQAAIGVLRGLHEAGVRVPEQMSVTGFDDVPSSRYVTPTLTTAHVPVRELGELAIQKLVGRIDGRDGETGERLPVEIVLRRSSGPPRLTPLFD